MPRRKKNINIRLIAEAAGVSVATVSRVVNNRTDVSEDSRRRVTEVIERFQFTPTRRVERRLNIGIVVVVDMPMLPEYTTEILAGASCCSGADNLDVTILLYRVTAAQKSLLQTLRERRCDAVAIISPEALGKQLSELVAAEIPAILINCELSGPKMGWIGTESFQGAVKAMEYLISCGHRKIGFLCNLPSSGNHRQRLAAYEEVMKRHGIEPEPAWIVPHQPTQLTADAGYEQCRVLLERAPEVTAVFCTNDEMAMGAIKACWSAGKRVPEDISIIGFDGIPFCRYLNPALTTVRQPLFELGSCAVKYLGDFLKGRRARLPTELFETELVIRDSVAVIHDGRQEKEEREERCGREMPDAV